MTNITDITGTFTEAELSKLIWPVAWSGTTPAAARAEYEAAVAALVEDARAALRDSDGAAVEIVAGRVAAVIEAEPVREMVLVLHRDAWGSEVTAEEHAALCTSAEEWLTAHEGDALSIRVRPSRDGEVDGLRVLVGGELDGPDLRRLDEDLRTLTNRAWDHAVQSAHAVLKR